MNYRREHMFLLYALFCENADAKSSIYHDIHCFILLPCVERASPYVTHVLWIILMIWSSIKTNVPAMYSNETKAKNKIK